MSNNLKVNLSVFITVPTVEYSMYTGVNITIDGFIYMIKYMFLFKYVYT